MKQFFVFLVVMFMPVTVLAVEEFPNEMGYTLVLPAGSRLDAETESPYKDAAPEVKAIMKDQRYIVPGADGSTAIVESMSIRTGDLGMLPMYLMTALLDDKKGIERTYFPKRGLCREFGHVRKTGETICSYRYTVKSGSVMFVLVLPDGNIENFSEVDAMLNAVPFDEGRVDVTPIEVMTITVLETVGFWNALTLLGILAVLGMGGIVFYRKRNAKIGSGNYFQK